MMWYKEKEERGGGWVCIVDSGNNMINQVEGKGPVFLLYL